MDKYGDCNIKPLQGNNLFLQAISSAIPVPKENQYKKIFFSGKFNTFLAYL